MPRKKGHPRAHRPARRGASAARTLARGSIIVAGLALTQLAPPESDPRFSLFDPTLLDRLHVPMSRHHE
ncbi:MAG TPA: hypothetical protein VGG34_14435 [Opitutaceae bacterium]|jgi:hypothetical protein